MTQEDVIARLCALATEVGGSEKFHNMYAHDCFCADRESIPPDSYYARFQFQEEIILYIEGAVRDALTK